MEPSQEEVEKAICNLKIHKAPGEDDIMAELIKNVSQELQKKFHARYVGYGETKRCQMIGK